MPATEAATKQLEVATEHQKVTGGKRKARVNLGQHVCWCHGCGRSEQLKAVPKEFVPDARFVMEHVLRIDPAADGADGKPRVLPYTLNKLCPQHYPTLPEQPILGTKVLVTIGDKMVEGVCDAPKDSARRAASGWALSAVTLLREQRWLVRTSEGGRCVPTRCLVHATYCPHHPESLPVFSCPNGTPAHPRVPILQTYTVCGS